MPAEIEQYDWQLEASSAVFEDDDIEQVAVLGSRGPGKSWWMRHTFITRCLMMPGTEHILFRRTSDDIVKQYAPALKSDLRNFGGVEIKAEYNQTYKKFLIPCPNGGESTLYLGFAESLKHAEKYMGMEYATVGFDEVTHFEEVIYDLICGSMRGKRDVKRIVTGNPGGIGHGWVKRRFIQNGTRDEKTKVLRPLLRDNLALMEADPKYADRLLRGLPEWKRKQWLDGDWDASEGQYFNIPPGCVRFVNPPQWARWSAGVDWGYSPSAFGVLWIATWREAGGKHRAHVYQELKAHKLTDPQQARAALDMEESLPNPPLIRFADPSTGKRNAGETVEETRTTALTWAKYGFHTVPAKRKERIPGWALVRQFFEPVEGYSPDPETPHGVLTISPNCRNLITEVTEAQFKQQGGQITSDDLEGEDHLLDPLRYALSMVYNMSYPVETLDAYTYRQIAA